MKDISRLEALAQLLDQLQDINASPMMIANVKEEILNLKNNHETTETTTDL